MTISLPEDGEILGERIKESIGSEFFLEKLTYDSDVYFEEREFLYLVGLQEKKMVTVDDVQRAVSRLRKKNKFEKIAVTFCLLDNGVHLHLGLEGTWEFHKLKLHGILVGKEKYRKYYLIEPGESFILEKHNHSLHKMREAFRVEGYFGGNVSSSINHAHETKLVTVNLTLDRGKKFSISQVEFFIESSNNQLTDELDILSRKIDSLFKKRLLQSGYSKSLINKETRALKKYLSKKGFLHVDIELLESIDYVSRAVSLKFILDIHSKRGFVFFGNSFFSNSQLLDKILRFGKSAWLVPASILSGEIFREYHKNGFWNDTV